VTRVDSLQGHLLISSPLLQDPNFRRTVVLMTHHDEEGAMGLVLSRPSEVRVADAVPELADLPGTGERVYVGGPVQPEAVVVLVEHEDEPESAIVGNIAFMAAESELDELDAVRARVFAGYSGWGPGQLEDELEESSWIVVLAEPDDAFAADPDELWRAVLYRKGGKFRWIASMPYDPKLN
jgi:putative transcriptional regulator